MAHLIEYISGSLFKEIYYYSLLLSSIFILFFIKKVQRLSLIISSIVIFSMLHNWIILGLILNGVLESNKAVYHFTTFIEFILFFLFYRNSITSYYGKLWVLAGGVIYFVFQLINSFLIQHFSYYNSNGIIIEETILVFYALLFFSEIRQHVFYDNLFKEGFFWFNTMVLVFNSFQVFIWGFQGFLQTPLWWFDISKILSAIMYLVFAFAVYLDYFSNRSKSNYAG